MKIGVNTTNYQNKVGVFKKNNDVNFNAFKITDSKLADACKEHYYKKIAKKGGSEDCLANMYEAFKKYINASCSTLLDKMKTCYESWKILDKSEMNLLHPDLSPTEINILEKLVDSAQEITSLGQYKKTLK